MQLSLTFVTGLIAAGLALAAPVPTGSDDAMLRVPLTKRRIDLFVSDDSDLIDDDKVSIHIKKLRNKYSHTLENLALHENNEQKRAISNIPLEPQGPTASFYSGNVQFGGQTLNIDFDTGSSDVTLNRGAWKPTANSVRTGKRFQNVYGTATNRKVVEGEVYQDSFASGNVKASKASIGLITGSDNIIDGADGLVGLAYPSISNYGSALPPLFDSLMQQNAVTNKVFGFSLGPQGSELTLGGIDSSKYSGQITYTPVTKQAYWEVDASVNGQRFSSLIDTGTTLVVAPTQQAISFFRRVGATPTQASSGDIYGVVPCNQVPKITFTYGGKQIAMEGDSSVFGRVDSSRCALSIIGADFGQQAWITGDSLLVNTYTVFDRAQNRVGFATKK